MWKPADKIKYQPQPGSSPTAEQAAQARLFSAVHYRNLKLQQRTWVPAMVPWRSNEAGEVTDDVLAWYERFAKGQPGAIVVEATGIRDLPSGPLLRIGDDRFIPGLRELAQVVKQASAGKTRLFIQIIDFLTIRRRPQRQKYLEKFLPLTTELREKTGQPQASDAEIRHSLVEMDDEQLATILNARELDALTMGYRERITDIHLPHIQQLPQVLPDLFSQAAARAQRAGIDGVELHYAHAYTMASFLSAKNTRDDGYGLSLQGRARLPLEVYAAVRAAVGEEYCVGCRFLSEECIAAGSTLQDAVFFAREFAGAGMDFLSLSRGGKFEDAKQPQVGAAAYPYTGQSGYECMPGYISDAQGPFGRNVAPAAAIKASLNNAALKTPLVVAGGIHGFAQAEAILKAGQADIISAARQSLADPDWFLKLRLGRGEEIRVCEYTNYCEGLDQKHKQVTCQLWDRQELQETGLSKSIDGRRRLVAPAWKAAK